MHAFSRVTRLVDDGRKGQASGFIEGLDVGRPLLNPGPNAIEIMTDIILRDLLQFSPLGSSPRSATISGKRSGNFTE